MHGDLAVMSLAVERAHSDWNAFVFRFDDVMDMAVEDQLYSVHWILISSSWSVWIVVASANWITTRPTAMR